MTSQKHLLNAVLITGALCAICSNAASAEIRVRSNAPNDFGPGSTWANAFKTIQSAINAASPGDSIWLAGFGPYYITSQIQINKQLRILGGFNGTEPTESLRSIRWNQRPLVEYQTWGGVNPGAIATVTSSANGTVIDGVEFRGGNANRGAALDISANSVTVNDCWILFNLGNVGTALSVQNCTNTTISRSFFMGNRASGAGTGRAPIYVDTATNFQLLACEFDQEDQGDSVIHLKNSTYLICNNSFCTAKNLNYVIESNASTGRIVNNIFDQNQTALGIVRAFGIGTVIASNNLFYGNTNGFSYVGLTSIRDVYGDPGHKFHSRYTTGVFTTWVWYPHLLTIALPAGDMGDPAYKPAFDFLGDSYSNTIPDIGSDESYMTVLHATVVLKLGVGKFGSQWPSRLGDLNLQAVVRNAADGALISMLQPGVEADGSFIVPFDVLPGIYDITITAKGFLSKKFRSVPITSPFDETHGFDLIGGDIDGDNAVTVYDYNIVSEFFDSSSEDSGWSTVGENGFAPRDADLDYDGIVGVFDYVMLSESFDMTGDV